MFCVLVDSLWIGWDILHLWTCLISACLLAETEKVVWIMVKGGHIEGSFQSKIAQKAQEMTSGSMFLWGVLQIVLFQVLHSVHIGQVPVTHFHIIITWFQREIKSGLLQRYQQQQWFRDSLPLRSLIAILSVLILLPFTVLGQSVPNNSPKAKVGLHPHWIVNYLLKPQQCGVKIVVL